MLHVHNLLVTSRLGVLRLEARERGREGGMEGGRHLLFVPGEYFVRKIRSLCRLAIIHNREQGTMLRVIVPVGDLHPELSPVLTVSHLEPILLAQQVL